MSGRVSTPSDKDVISITSTYCFMFNLVQAGHLVTKGSANRSVFARIYWTIRPCMAYSAHGDFGRYAEDTSSPHIISATHEDGSGY